MHPPRQDGQGPEFAVGKSPGLGRDFKGHGPDTRRSGQGKHHGRPPSRFHGERHCRDGLGQAEGGGQVFPRRRVEDFERHRSRQARFARIIDHDPELGSIALAEKSRQIRPHHQLLDRAGLFLQSPGHEVAGDTVDEDAPSGDGIGYGKFHRRRAVRPGQEMGLPEGRLIELGAQRDRLLSRSGLSGLRFFFFGCRLLRRHVARGLFPALSHAGGGRGRDAPDDSS